MGEKSAPNPLLSQKNSNEANVAISRHEKERGTEGVLGNLLFGRVRGWVLIQVWYGFEGAEGETSNRRKVIH